MYKFLLKRTWCMYKFVLKRSGSGYLALLIAAESFNAVLLQQL